VEESFSQLRKLAEFDQLTAAHLGVITAQLLSECLAHPVRGVDLPPTLLRTLDQLERHGQSRPV
jgi:hypothetical protein